jgi:hypothetical protein
MWYGDVGRSVQCRTDMQWSQQGEPQCNMSAIDCVGGTAVSCVGAGGCRHSVCRHDVAVWPADGMQRVGHLRVAMCATDHYPRNHNSDHYRSNEYARRIDKDRRQHCAGPTIAVIDDAATFTDTNAIAVITNTAEADTSVIITYTV